MFSRVFRQTFKQALETFLFVFVFVILRNELKQFASGAVLSFTKKKSQLASNFKLTRTPTIYGEHGIIAHIP